MNRKRSQYSRWDDTNDNAVLITPQCMGCAHWHGPHYPSTCDAFPNHIPRVIYLNEVLHNTDYSGDQGIHYEPKV